MKLQHLLFLLVPIILITLSFSCKSPSGPEPTKNPREYTWTVDTLAYPGSYQTSMRDIWASSPSDVYVVGHNDNPGDPTMFHFDGKSWKTTGFHSSGGGSISGPITLSTIIGFASNDIWAVGQRIYNNPTPQKIFLDSSFIIHFDGHRWREQNVQRGRSLWSIWGSRPNDIWASGYNGTLYHFDGSLWKADSVPLVVPLDGEYFLSYVQGRSLAEVFIFGVVHQNSIVRTTQYFFERKNNQWNLVDSFYLEPGHVNVKFGQFGLWASPQGTLYSFGPHIFRWDGSSWIKFYDIFDALRKMAGTSDNNIFAVGDFGNILHYNGIDWYQYKELKNNNVVYSSVWTDGKEVFVVGYLNDGSKTLILHGK